MVGNRSLRVLLIACAALALLVFATPALAMHPEEWNAQNPGNPNPSCDGNLPEGYELRLPSGPNDPEGGEAWECKYDPDLGAWYWEPVPPDTTPYDATGWIDYAWAHSGVHAGVSSYLIQSYNEWISSTYRAGYFVSVDHPSTSPGVPANQLGVYQRVYTWNSATSAWEVCNNTGWEFGSGTGNIINITNTAHFAAATCGSRWYTAATWIEVWNPSTSSWQVSSAADPSTSAGQHVGYAAYGDKGNVWDPIVGERATPPGWLGVPAPAPVQATNNPLGLAGSGIAPPQPTLLDPAGVARAVRSHGDGISQVRAIGGSAR
jgi:hypothetical protein